MATELQVINGTFEAGDLLPDRASAKRQLQSVREFQATVRELFVQGHDFGVIPGTGTKATLLKPGAEKLAKLLGLADHYEIVNQIEDWDKPLFRYVIRCRLDHMGSGATVSEGLGECNSMESKYRWRYAWPNDVSKEEKVRLDTLGQFRTTRNGGKQYRIENDDIYSQINTILKMAKKRALVDAALSAGRLSDVFTQDMEDFSDVETAPPPPVSVVTKPTPTPVPHPAGPMKREELASQPDDVEDVQPIEESQAFSEIAEVNRINKAWARLTGLAEKHNVPYSEPEDGADLALWGRYVKKLAKKLTEAGVTV